MMGTDVRVRRVYDESSPEDGARVLVDRVWPRGMRKEAARLDEWAKDVAPSAELRTWYRHDPVKFDEFRRRYTAELAQPGAKEAPHDQTLTPNYDVHDVLASVGLEDAAALASGPGGSPGPGPAGTGSSGRADRLYLTWDLADAAAGYTWQDTGDSEHQVLLFTLDGLRAARAIPPQPGQ